MVEMVHGGSDFCQTVLSDGKMDQILQSYKPSWFYFEPVFGQIASVLLCSYKKIEYQSHQFTGEAGLVTHDYVRSSTNP